MLAAAQLEILDGCCGAEQAARPRRVRRGLGGGRGARAELAALEELAGARERELDLLDFELGEIEQRRARARASATSSPPSASGCATSRRCAAAPGAPSRRSPDEDAGALRALLAAEASLEAPPASTPALEPLAARARALAIEAQDLLSELRALRRGARARSPAASRRSRSGSRRSPGSSASTAAASRRCSRTPSAAARAASELAGRRGRDGGRARHALDAARGEHAERGRARSARRAARRRRGSPRRSRERLEALAMGEASFDVALVPCEPGRHGAEHAPVRDRPQPGRPGRAAARHRLGRRALPRDARAARRRPRRRQRATLVFDEIDAGVGGHTARAVAEQLRALADGRQILAHHAPAAGRLARGAPLHDRQGHARASRRAPPSRAWHDDEVVGELVRMLGADAADTGARRHAKELLRAA